MKLILAGIAMLAWIIYVLQTSQFTNGVIYSLSIVILLAALGVFVFGETLNRREVVGFISAGANM